MSSAGCGIFFGLTIQHGVSNASQVSKNHCLRGGRPASAVAEEYSRPYRSNDSSTTCSADDISPSREYICAQRQGLTRMTASACSTLARVTQRDQGSVHFLVRRLKPCEQHGPVHRAQKVAISGVIVTVRSSRRAS